MSRKWIYALAALLGFSTACSTVRPVTGKRPGGKETEKRDSKQKAADTLRVIEVHREVRVMYGPPAVMYGPAPMVEEVSESADTSADPVSEEKK